MKERGKQTNLQEDYQQDFQVIYCYIDSADMDSEGNGHIQISKHKQSEMEKTIQHLRRLRGKSVAIFIDTYKGDK